MMTNYLLIQQQKNFFSLKKRSKKSNQTKEHRLKIRTHLIVARPLAKAAMIPKNNSLFPLEHVRKRMCVYVFTSGDYYLVKR